MAGGFSILAALLAAVSLGPRPAAAADDSEVLLRPAQVFTADDGLVHKGWLGWSETA